MLTLAWPAAGGFAGAPQPLLHRTTRAPAASRSAGAAIYCKKKDDEDNSPYRSSVLLPDTSFNQRAMSVTREPELQKFWEDERIYEELAENNPGEPFVLHDGPPYANGDLHIGHALNKILKDIINRYQMLQGRKVQYVPGWDCHGLPIELKVLQGMKSKERQALTPLELRKKAAGFARETTAKQSASFRRYGVWGDFENPYLTLQPEYEAAQIAVFGQMYLKGHIYRGRSKRRDVQIGRHRAERSLALRTPAAQYSAALPSLPHVCAPPLPAQSPCTGRPRRGPRWPRRKSNTRTTLPLRSG